MIEVVDVYQYLDTTWLVHKIPASLVWVINWGRNMFCRLGLVQPTLEAMPNLHICSQLPVPNHENYWPLVFNLVLWMPTGKLYISFFFYDDTVRLFLVSFDTINGWLSTFNRYQACGSWTRSSFMKQHVEIINEDYSLLLGFLLSHWGWNPS